jgi:hypothetical protein
MKWGLIGLAWGDVMASLELAKRKGIRNIIYVGPYANIATFIQEQDFIDIVEFRTYDFDKRYDFMKYFCRMANQDYVSDQINYVYNLFKLQSVCNLEDIESCQCDWSATVDVIEMPEDLKVPESSKIEARQLLGDVEDFILIQSQSNHSNAENAHWPYWDDFINYVIENNNGKTIVLVGEKAIESEYDSKILDLRGKTSSADVVFYLAELSSLVITVPNGVYHWCNIKDLNAINISQRSFHQCNPFYRTVNSLNCKDVFFIDGLERAIYLYNNQEKTRLEDIKPGEFIPKNSYIKRSELKERISDTKLGAIDEIFKIYRDENWWFTKEFPIQYIWNGLKYLPKTEKIIYPSIIMLDETEEILKLFKKKFQDSKRITGLPEEYILFTKYAFLNEIKEVLKDIKTLCFINIFKKNDEVENILEDYFYLEEVSTHEVKLYKNKKTLR